METIMAPVQQKQNKLPKFLTGTALACCMLTAAMPRLAVPCAIILLPCMAGLFFFEEFYLLSAIFLFFTEQLVVTANMPVYRAYAYLLLLRFIIFDIHRVKAKAWILPITFILILYGIFVLPHVNISNTIRLFEQRGIVPPSDMSIRAKFIWNYVVNCIYVIFLSTKFANSHALLRRFLKWLVILAVISGIYGLRANNIYIYDETGFVDITRQRASFNDPNYASLFMNIAIFITLCLDDFKSWKIKAPLLAALYYFLIASGSMTGFALNFCGLLAFAVLRYRVRAAAAIAVMAAAAGIASAVVINVPVLYQSDVVQSVVTRIQYQFEDSDTDDLNRLTSGRAGQWKMYGDYFLQQDPAKKLFGGNIVMTSSLDKQFEENFKYGPHQAYLGLLLDIGIIGTAIMLIAFLVKMFFYAWATVRQKDDLSFSLFMLSLSWLIYGMALDYFFDIRFMLFYFL